MLDVIYKGVSLNSIGFDYIPTAQQRGDTVSSFQVTSNDYTSRDGGIRYGSRVETKKFELKFFYEEIPLQKKEQFVKLFDRKNTGELYFTERPYAKYIAYVASKPTFEEYGFASRVYGRRYSGMVTVNMEAYMPFAKLTDKYLDDLEDTNTYHMLQDETSMVLIAQDPMYSYISAVTTKPGEFIYDLPTISTTSWNLKILYPGTEYGRLSFDIAGTVGENGLTIYNSGTQQTCSVIGLTSAVTDTLSRWYHINSETGQCVLTNGISKSIDYMFHDNGYISLLPADIIRDMRIQTTSGSTTVNSVNGEFDASLVGKYIYIGNDWKAITTYTSPNQITVGTAASSTADTLADIVNMNIVTITGGVDTALSKLRLYMQGYVR